MDLLKVLMELVESGTLADEELLLVLDLIRQIKRETPPGGGT